MLRPAGHFHVEDAVYAYDHADAGKERGMIERLHPGKVEEPLRIQ